FLTGTCYVKSWQINITEVDCLIPGYDGNMTIRAANTGAGCYSCRDNRNYDTDGCYSADYEVAHALCSLRNTINLDHPRAITND
ncbi:MAG: hypothetical protein QNL87_02730, partial [Gammaproteobacteria bacterium]|nr:hypothetical protein [Gammaproteobacteria bacterium]